jgi:uracil phosphoribosyltransferase
MGVNIHTLADQPSVFGHLIAEIRDIGIQQDRLRFRRNMERLGELFAYEISKTLDYEEKLITTPLGTAPCQVLVEQPVLATILRAGLPLHQGLLNIFDQAENAFISAYRKHHGDEESFEVEIEYLSSPVLNDKALLQRGVPRHIHVVAAIASRQGVDFTVANLPPNTTLWLGAVDAHLTPKAYILPGLGDAGDLAYGDKE